MKFLHEIVKYPNAELPYDNGYWLIVRGEPSVGNTIRVENYNGGFHDHVVTEDDVIVESDWQTVERAFSASETWRDCGWIDKEGVFYGCGYMDHAVCLYAIAGLDTLAAEQAGYIKIYRDPTLAKYMPEYAKDDEFVYYIDPQITMTKAQKDTLLERGFKVNEY